MEALLDRAAAGRCALHICAASLADATLVHKDPEFAQLAGEVDLESLPFKARR